MRLLACASFALASACIAPISDPEARTCDTMLRYGVSARVRDASTKASICDATITVRDGSYVETLQKFPAGDGACTFSGIPERPGTYTVTVSAPGYRSSAPTVVALQQGTCHVESRSIEIELEKQVP